MFVKWLMDVSDKWFFDSRSIDSLKIGDRIKLNCGHDGTVKDIINKDVGYTTEYLLSLKDGGSICLNSENRLYITCGTTNGSTGYFNADEIYNLYCYYVGNKEVFGRLHRLRIRALNGEKLVIENIVKVGKVKRCILLLNVENEQSGILITNNGYTVEIW